MSSIELWPKQQEVFNFACFRDEVALLCEQRTGKTFITLKLVKNLLEQGEESQEEFVGLLVCILNNKESTWGDKLQEYIPELPVYRDWELFKRAKGHRLFMIHYEELPKLIKKLVKYKKLNWCGVDEAHRLYNRGSGQSRAMARLHWIRRKLLLTGTPMEKKPTDFFAQFRFLAPQVFGTNHAKFEEKWLDWRRIDMDPRHGPKPGGPAWQQKMMQQRILKNKAKFREELLPEFVGLLSPYCIRIEKEDVGILPPVVKLHQIEMGPMLMSRYARLKKTSILTLGDGDTIMAPMPATLVMKLRQVASGFIFDEDQNLHWLSSRKLHYAVQLFESLPKPVVIFSSFVPEVLRIHRELGRLGYDVGLVYGKIPKKTRPGLWRSFQAGQLDAIVCQTSAGGVGVDLWKSNHAIVTSMSYSSIIWDQAKARLDSRDKSVAATIHLLNSMNTIDEDLFDLIVVKGQTTKSVLSKLKRRYRCRPKPPLPPNGPLRPARRCRSTTSPTSRPT